MSAIRLLVVDDHPIVRDGLRGVFAGDDGFFVVGEAADGAEALARVAHDAVDVVLMDLRMPGMGGVEAIKALRVQAPDVKVLVLTTYDGDRDVLPAVEAGAIGYLLKDSPREELLRGVRAAHEGRPLLSPTVAARLMKLSSSGGASAKRASPGTLSTRELEVLRLIAAGSTNQAVARELFISEATVKTHLLHVYEKLGVRDRAAAVSAGYRKGLLT